METKQRTNSKLQITNNCAKPIDNQLITLKLHDLDRDNPDNRLNLQQRSFCTFSLAETMYLYLKHNKIDFTTLYISLYKTLHQAYTFYNKSFQSEPRFLAGAMVTPIDTQQSPLEENRSFFLNSSGTGLQYFLTQNQKNLECVAIEIDGTGLQSMEFSSNHDDYVKIPCTVITFSKDTTNYYPLIVFQGKKYIFGNSVQLNSTVTRGATKQNQKLEQCIWEQTMRQNQALYKNAKAASFLLAGMTVFCGKMSEIANISSNMYMISNDKENVYVVFIHSRQPN